MFFDWNASRPTYLGVYVVSPLRRRRLLLVPPKSRKGGDILLLASGIFGNSLGEAVYTASCVINIFGNSLGEAVYVN